MRRHRMRLSEHPPQHLTGQRDRHRRRVVGDLTGELVRRRQQVVGRVHRAHQPGGEGLLDVEHAARIRPFCRLADADDPRQEPRRSRLGHQPPTSEHEPEAGALRCQSDVHWQRHRCPDADRRTVHRGDHGLRAPEDAQRHQSTFVTVLAVALEQFGVVERPASFAEVGAGTEAPPSAGHDDDAHVVVGVGSIEGVQQLFVHPVRERVESVGTLEGDRQDAVGDLVTDLVVLHAAHPGFSWYRRDRSVSPVPGERWRQTSRKRVAATAEPNMPTSPPAAMSTYDVPRRSATSTWKPVQMPPPLTSVGSIQARIAATVAMPIALPKTPCTRPSAMNGIRMNQFVAPTSFITSISRRRANIAMRIEFTMSTSDVAPTISAMISAKLLNFEKLLSCLRT